MASIEIIIDTLKRLQVSRYDQMEYGLTCISAVPELIAEVERLQAELAANLLQPELPGLSPMRQEQV